MNYAAYISPDQADANAYWADKEFKKFVITLQRGPHRRPETETLYVRARTAALATAVGKANASRIKRPTRVTARLATAYDLGCVRTPS